MSMAMIAVLMGVTGCGKTSVGEQLAERLGWAMLEGDSFHPQSNKDKMSSGTPLTDEDRWPWLEEIGRQMRKYGERNESAVVTCSALKRAYRNRLRQAAGTCEVRFVHLTGARPVLEERMRARTGHFMPASMLDSQLETLETPGTDENAITVDIDQPLDTIVNRIITRLGR